ncbi:DUF3800 domain-containing protein [Rhodoplanes sp.]|uniref:DUF3800 domain-containing protein n=1 Tax=Rhodoplanes sp. TaxID=1968906 RepID=UPI0025D51E81|nr:DUF3800 domain-containing protein [Rhodoplanes sp.]
MTRTSEIIEAADFTIIAAVIDKQQHIKRYSEPADPYEIGLTFCMERLFYFLSEKKQVDRVTHLLVECRGAKEDARLELEFRRICDGRNRAGKMPNFDIRFMDKKHNSTGLQLADLVAHPVGRHVIDPTQPNRAYEIVQTKFRRSRAGQFDGYGLKIFP